MKTLSEKELEKKADKLFEKVSTDEMFGTSDGQFFYRKGDAHSHAGPKGNVYTFTKKVKENAGEKGEPKPITVKKLAEMVADCQEVDKLNEMLGQEAAGANRATAIKAISDRIEELTKTEQ